jgi:alkanesulfonate monooxygenase SsuD/methylene tetrahydromethanopterin reductase-like flavin-dependent oxidoreductase (luciferase family)
VKIGALFNLETAPEANALLSYHQIRAAAQRIEAGGLDSIWFWDHFLFRREGARIAGIWECWSMLAALASSTGP